jgi:hypothetical protein
MQNSGVFAAKTPAPFPVAAASVSLDSRLIAAVQTRAGARCHRSANLLHGYYMSADAYRLKLRTGDAAAADYARRRMQLSEDRLREFLSSCSPAAFRPSPSAYACVA